MKITFETEDLENVEDLKLFLHAEELRLAVQEILEVLRKTELVQGKSLLGEALVILEKLGVKHLV